MIHHQGRSKTDQEGIGRIIGISVRIESRDLPGHSHALLAGGFSNHFGPGIPGCASAERRQVPMTHSKTYRGHNTCQIFAQ